MTKRQSRIEGGFAQEKKKKGPVRKSLLFQGGGKGNNRAKKKLGRGRVWVERDIRIVRKTFMREFGEGGGDPRREFSDFASFRITKGDEKMG